MRCQALFQPSCFSGKCQQFWREAAHLPKNRFHQLIGDNVECTIHQPSKREFGRSSPWTEICQTHCCNKGSARRPPQQSTMSTLRICTSQIKIENNATCCSFGNSSWENGKKSTVNPSEPRTKLGLCWPIGSGSSSSTSNSLCQDTRLRAPLCYLQDYKMASSTILI